MISYFLRLRARPLMAAKFSVAFQNAGKLSRTVVEEHGDVISVCADAVSSLAYEVSLEHPEERVHHECKEDG